MAGGGGYAAGCSGYDHKSVCFFPHFAFEGEGYHSAVGRETPHIELSGDSAVKIQGYYGI